MHEYYGGEIAGAVQHWQGECDRHAKTTDDSRTVRKFMGIDKATGEQDGGAAGVGESSADRPGARMVDVAIAVRSCEDESADMVEGMENWRRMPPRV